MVPVRDRFSVFVRFEEPRFFHAVCGEFSCLIPYFAELLKHAGLFCGYAECGPLAFGAEKDRFLREFVCGEEAADVEGEVTGGAVIPDAVVAGVFFLGCGGFGCGGGFGGHGFFSLVCGDGEIFVIRWSSVCGDELKHVREVWVGYFRFLLVFCVGKTRKEQRR